MHGSGELLLWGNQVTGWIVSRDKDTVSDDLKSTKTTKSLVPINLDIIVH